jgi:uncharacterized protein (DUF2267 family)
MMRSSPQVRLSRPWRSRSASSRRGGWPLICRASWHNLRPLPDGVTGHYSFGEFCVRVAIREESNVPDAIAHARAIIDALQVAVDLEDCAELLVLLKEELAPLFCF